MEPLDYRAPTRPFALRHWRRYLLAWLAVGFGHLIGSFLSFMYLLYTLDDGQPHPLFYAFVQVWQMPVSWIHVHFGIPDVDGDNLFATVSALNAVIWACCFVGLCYAAATALKRIRATR